MREILFIGKRKDNKKWVEGNFVKFIDGDKIIPCIYGQGEIIVDTLGEYTGLTDKNGERIFEGHILKWINTDGDEIYTSVGFKDGCFVINPEREDTEVLYDYLPLDMEIAGNVYDNPELLG